MEYEMLSLFALTPDLVCIAGSNGYFKKVNPAVLQQLEYSEEEIYTRPIDSFIHPDDLEATRQARRRLLNGETLVNYQNRYLKKSGEVVWLQWTSVYLPAREIVFAIAKDITVNKRRELETETNFHTYRELASHFKTRAENDKHVLARELHEELAQLAAVQKMNMVWLKKRLEAQPAPVTRKMEETLQLAEKLILDIRRLSISTSPGIMDDLGMHAAFEWKCGDFSRSSGIPCHYEGRCREEELSRELRIDFFRVCEAALDNIREHAQASAAWVTTEDRETAAAIVITDNGKGFAQHPGHAGEGGLQYIRKLALSVNGTLDIESIPGEGTRISLVAPKQSAFPGPSR